MELKAGPQLDELIATKVMGGVRHEVNSVLKVDVSAKSYTLGKGWEYPRYSTDITAAWEVVGKLNEVYFMISTRSYVNQPNQSQCLILPKAGEDAWITATGESIPHAICLAALKAIS
jgi:hypothetical protein